MTRMVLSFNEETKNLIVSCVVMGMCQMALGPAAAVQNIALAESSDIDLNVGYYSEIVKYVASIVVGFIFYPFYKWTGIRVTAVVATLLVTGLFWTMIWIVNEYVIYFGAFLTGIGWGAMWIIWPMTIIDNSHASSAQKNMGIWLACGSLGVFLGGLSNFLYFEKVTKISSTNRVMVYSICTAVTVLAAALGGISVSDIKKCSSGPGKKGDFTNIDNPGTKTKVAAADWFKKMAKRPEFWLLFLPLIYWGFIWGFFIKMLPTAVASISNQRNLIPLGTLALGASYLVGSLTWTYVTKFLNNTICIILASCLDLAAIILSVLIFPKGAASEVLDVETIETYIEPLPVYIVLISVFIGLADSCISIIYFSIAGRIYGKDGTSLGFSINNVGFCVFYILSMFTPSLFDLHSYCYAMIGAVLVMCITLTVFFRRFMSGPEVPQRLESEEMENMRESE